MSPQQEQGLVPQCPGSWDCPSAISSLVGTCVGDARAGGFPGVSSGGWQPSPAAGVWGHGCAYQWRFVLLLLRPAVAVAWPRVGAVAGTGFQSPVNLSCSLSLSSSMAAGWVPPCQGFWLADSKSHFSPGTSGATAPTVVSPQGSPRHLTGFGLGPALGPLTVGPCCFGL